MADQADSKEAKLLRHVQQTVQQGDAKGVVAAIDKYGWSTEWFMNVGDTKGTILDGALHKAQPVPKRLLELGAYCGYSATRIGSQLAPGAKLYSIEIDATNAGRARQMLAHAGLGGASVEVLQGSIQDTAAELKQRGHCPVDFVFIDHHKEVYLRDLLFLKENGFLRPGTVVVADNLVYPGAPDYIEYMKSSQDFDTEFVETHLEYKAEQPDLVGISVYKGPAH